MSQIEENSINSIEEVEKIIPKNKIEVNVKRPLTAYFLFCQEKRKKFYEESGGKKINPRTLGQLWQNLSPERKRPYQEMYKKNKKEYDDLVSKLKKIKNSATKEKGEGDDDDDIDDANAKTEKEKKKRKRKVKAKTNKEDNRKYNIQACNCGECDDCKKKKTKKTKKKE